MATQSINFSHFLFEKNAVLSFLIPFIILLLFFHLGYYSSNLMDASVIRIMGVMQTGLMSLLALLLAFTFSMAINRFDNRKKVIISEAAAIGDCYYHSRLLPQPFRDQYRYMLIDYVEIRTKIPSPNPTKEMLEEIDSLSLLQVVKIWTLIAAYAIEFPHGSTILIQSFNQMEKSFAKRRYALLDHVPETILWLLLIVACVVFGGMGFYWGTINYENLYYPIAFDLLICATFITILDMDRLNTGLIKQGQKSLLELKNNFQTKFSPDLLPVNPYEKTVRDFKKKQKEKD